MSNALPVPAMGAGRTQSSASASLVPTFSYAFQPIVDIVARGIRQVCMDLGIDVIAEGVETLQEFRWFEDHDIRLFQGYLFAKPAFEKFSPASYPESAVKQS